VFVAGLGRCWVVAGAALGAGGLAVGVRRGGRESIFFPSSSTVSVRWRICFCISSSRYLMSLRPRILTVVNWLAS